MPIIIGIILGQLVVIIALAVLLGKACTERNEKKDELLSVREICKDILEDLARAKEDMLMWKRGLNKVGGRDKDMVEENTKLKVENEKLKKTLDEFNKFDRSDILDLEE